MHTAEKKTSVRVFGLNKLFWKVRLDIQPVQLISPTSITDKKIHQPSNNIIILYSSTPDLTTAVAQRPGVFRVLSTGYFKTEYVTPVVFYSE